LEDIDQRDKSFVRVEFPGGRRDESGDRIERFQRFRHTHAFGTKNSSLDTTFNFAPFRP
jgi:hypothetical protein